MAVSASDLNVTLEALLDRTAYLKQQTAPDVLAMTANGAVWNKPTGAAWIEIVLVAKGGNGGSQGGTAGGGGGGAGEVISVRLPAAQVPATLTIAGLTGSSATLTGTGFALEATAGNNGSAGAGAVGGAAGPGGSAGGAGHGGYGPNGGAGAAPALAGGAGNRGQGGGTPGVGGAVTLDGQPGLGYGAGAGGSGGGGVTNGGGGGGGGGYGTVALATTGTLGSGVGAQGCAFITTIRNP